MKFDVEVLGQPRHNAERGLGVELVDRHQHAFGLFNYFSVSDDHVEFVTDLLLQIGVECFGDIDVEALGCDGPSGRVGDGIADNDDFAGLSGGGSYAMPTAERRG